MVSACPLCLRLQKMWIIYSFISFLLPQFGPVPCLFLKLIGRCHRLSPLYPMLGCSLKGLRCSLPFGVLFYLHLFGACGWKGIIESSRMKRRSQRWSVFVSRLNVSCGFLFCQNSSLYPSQTSLELGRNVSGWYSFCRIGVIFFYVFDPCVRGFFGPNCLFC